MTNYTAILIQDGSSRILFLNMNPRAAVFYLCIVSLLLYVIIIVHVEIQYTDMCRDFKGEHSTQDMSGSLLDGTNRNGGMLIKSTCLV